MLINKTTPVKPEIKMINITLVKHKIKVMKKQSNTSET